MLSAPTDPAGARRAATAVTEFLAPHLQRARIAEGEGKGEGDSKGEGKSDSQSDSKPSEATTPAKSPESVAS